MLISIGVRWLVRKTDRLSSNSHILDDFKRIPVMHYYVNYRMPNATNLLPYNDLSIDRFRKRSSLVIHPRIRSLI